MRTPPPLDLASEWVFTWSALSQDGSAFLHRPCREICHPRFISLHLLLQSVFLLFASALNPPANPPTNWELQFKCFTSHSTLDGIFQDQTTATGLAMLNTKVYRTREWSKIKSKDESRHEESGHSHWMRSPTRHLHQSRQILFKFSSPQIKDFNIDNQFPGTHLAQYKDLHVKTSK